MNSVNHQVFTAETKRVKKSLLSGFSYRTLYYIALIAVGMYIFSDKAALHEAPIIWAAWKITVFYTVIFSAIGYFSKKVNHVQFDNNFITFTYRRAKKTKQVSWKIKSTEIELFELKNHKSHFEGLQINFINKTEKTKLKLLESDWSYEDMEQIYFYFKNRKNEEIPENELLALGQLQIMTNSKTYH